jgi:hypothetical protein
MRSTSEFLNGVAPAEQKEAAKGVSRGKASGAKHRPPVHAPNPNPAVAARMDVARKAYSTHYTGLEGYGASGMTVLEELIDVSFQLCEKQSKQWRDAENPMGSSRGRNPKAPVRDSRAAALLAADGRVYTGVDVFAPHPSGGSGGGSSGSGSDRTSAEMVALLGAGAENCAQFVGLVIASDTLPPGRFPVPDGRSREYMRGFGRFAVYLVNSCLECRATSTEELFPAGAGGGGTGGTDMLSQSFGGAPLVLQPVHAGLAVGGAAARTQGGSGSGSGSVGVVEFEALGEAGRGVIQPGDAELDVSTAMNCNELQ